MEETRPVDIKKIKESELNFYYNREDRLAKASPRVRALYKEQPRRRFAFFSSMTDTKPKAMLFFSIIVLSLMIIFLTRVVHGSDRHFAGSGISVSAMRYNGASFIVIKKTTPRRGAWTGIVNVSVERPGGEGIKLSERQIVFTDEISEEYRWSIPIEASEFVVTLSTPAETARYHITAE